MVAMGSKVKRSDLAEAARLLREVLALVEAGELEATSPAARALVRRLEGAVVGLSLISGDGPNPPPAG
jgi:transcription elongation GreA/GreB family factor